MPYVYGGHFSARVVQTSKPEQIETDYSCTIAPLDVDRQSPICILHSSRDNQGKIMHSYHLVRAIKNGQSNQIKYESLTASDKLFPGCSLTLDGNEHTARLNNPNLEESNTCPIVGSTGLSIAQNNPFNGIEKVTVVSSDIPIFSLPTGTTPPTEFDECTAAHEILNDYLKNGDYSGSDNIDSIDRWHSEFVVYMSGEPKNQLFTITMTENEKANNKKYQWATTPSLAEPTITFTPMQANSRITFSSNSVTMGLDEFTLIFREETTDEEITVEFNVKEDTYNYIQPDSEHMSLLVIKGDPPPSDYDPP